MTEETEATSARTADRADSQPFGRGISLFDAVYGFAMTLLISNVDPPPSDAWRDLDSLFASAAGSQLLGFAISFVVIAVIWRANVRLMNRLSAMDGLVASLNLLASGLVILIAFTTQGISDPVASELPMPTVLYAMNIAAVSVTQTVMYQVARQRGFESPARSDADNRDEVLGALITPVVFLASIPVAMLVDANVAKLTWLSLVILNPVAGILLKRRAAARRR